MNPYFVWDSEHEKPEDQDPRLPDVVTVEAHCRADALAAFREFKLALKGDCRGWHYVLEATDANGGFEVVSRILVRRDAENEQ